jgi:hypothetical protein
VHPTTALVLARTFERMRSAVSSIRSIVVWIACFLLRITSVYEFLRETTETSLVTFGAPATSAALVCTFCFSVTASPRCRHA